MESHDASKRLTHEYYQTVLRLAHEFPDMNVAWDVSQNVLDKLWEDDGNKDSSAEDRAESTAIHPACQGCGHGLHPGWNGTSLRVKRPSRPSLVGVKKTLKRRELRQRKRAARAEEMKARDNRGRRHNGAANTNTNAMNTSSSSSNTRTDTAAATSKMVFLRDDPGIGRLDRNVLVLTCGRCCQKTNLKGLRREPPQRQNHQPPQAHRTGRRPTVATARTPQTGGGVANLSENFERLPRLSSKTPTITKPPNTVDEALSLLQRNKKRTKKTKAISSNNSKGNNTSGNLLNFLSSLNDH
jgi:hypothetical protein